MPSIGPSLFILGLVVTCVATLSTSAAPATTAGKPISQSTSNNTVTPTPLSTTRSSINYSANITTATSNITESSSSGTTPPPATTKKGDGGSSITTSPAPPVTTQSTTTAKDDGNQEGKKTSGSSDYIGIIILVVIIVVALGFGVACFITRKRGRRYSVDFTSRQDDVNIPLSTVEPEPPVDAAPKNGLQTFESAETLAKGPEEPTATPEAKEEPKAEPDKSVVDPSAESAAPPPSPETPEDKPKEEVVEPSPPAPVEPSAEEKTDDEGAVSSKTSVESLKETNENNSNNAGLSQSRDQMSSSVFWDVPLNCPV